MPTTTDRRYVCQLAHNEQISQVFLASDKQLRPNRNGNLYLQLQLSDRSGGIAARLWNASENDYRAFENGDYVCFSIECRKEKGEGYSAVKGLFRQFELVYIVADERDVVRLRTHYRQGEEVYLFRLKGSREQVRVLFLDYLHRMNGLKQRPEWYNAVSDNCTTGIRTQRAAADRAPWDWRMLVNGHGDELLYEQGMIATNLPLAELKQRAHINARARTADQTADYSRLIRQGVPGIEP